MAKVTPTNNANNSQGRYLGIEGNNVYYLAYSGGMTVITIILLGKFGVSFSTALMISVALFIVPVWAWVFLLKQGKPPQYDSDLYRSLEIKWRHDDGWVTGSRCKHPFRR